MTHCTESLTVVFPTQTLQYEFNPAQNPLFLWKEGIFLSICLAIRREKQLPIDKSICYNLVYLTTVNAVVENISKEEYA